MEKLVGACGLCCSDCDGYKASRAGDEGELAKLAAKASEQFGEEISPESLRCNGCLTDGDKCGYCGICQIRSCVAERGLQNCARCGDFECDKLSAFLDRAAKARENLMQIREEVGL